MPATELFIKDFPASTRFVNQIYHPTTVVINRISLPVCRTKLMLWDQSPSDKEVVVAYDGDRLHTFLLDLDNVAGPSVDALGRYNYSATLINIRK
jgi:hypothetical protein